MTNPYNGRRFVKPSLRAFIFERDNFRCVCCGKEGKEARLEIDHILPVSEGGGIEAYNLRLLCLECNRGRSGLKLQKQGIMKEFRYNAERKRNNHDDSQDKLQRELEAELEEREKERCEKLGIKWPLETVSLLSYRHSLMYQLKSFFIKPKTTWWEQDENSDWVECGVAFHLLTWRELFEQKLSYKWRRLKHKIYSTLFTIQEREIPQDELF